MSASMAHGYSRTHGHGCGYGCLREASPRQGFSLRLLYSHAWGRRKGRSHMTISLEYTAATKYEPSSGSGSAPCTSFLRCMDHGHGVLDSWCDLINVPAPHNRSCMRSCHTAHSQWNQECYCNLYSYAVRCVVTRCYSSVQTRRKV